MNESPRRRLSERMMNQKAGFTTDDKRRLYGLGVLLVLVLIAFFTTLKTAKRDTSDAQSIDVPPANVVLPPIDTEALAEVADGEASERILLEPDAYRSITTAAQLLLPSHFRYLEDTALPFDEIETVSSEWRGRPVRLRGELLATDRIVRSASAPSEFWCWLRTDGGHDVIFAALEEPTDLFGSENFVKADGLFFKIYTWTVDGKRVTAPLIVGKEIVPSFRPFGPESEPDATVLSRIRDPLITEDLPIDFDGQWHLLNVAQTLGDQPADLEAAFDGAPELSKAAMSSFFNDEAFRAEQRGKPWVIHSRIIDSWTTEAGENPLRLESITKAYGGNNNWGMPLVHVILPGSHELPQQGDSDNYRVLTGWFLQLTAYETDEGSRRRAPVFVVGGQLPTAEPGTPSWVLQLLGAFVVVAVGLTVLMMFLIRKDRDQAKRTTAQLERIREKNRSRKQEKAGA